MSRKSKGLNGERELVRAFWERGWASMRSAGSGSSHYPSPDIIAAKAGRRFAIECKVTAETRKYFAAKEISELKYFASLFGGEPFVSVKFPRKKWYFFTIEDLRDTGNNFAVYIEDCELKGLLIDELIA